MIAELIRGDGAHRVVRDQIAALLKAESANQEQLAANEGEDPRRWSLRVFRGRANPWDEFNGLPDNEAAEASPIVNVWFDSSTVDWGRSDPVRRQVFSATFNVDVYGYGVSGNVEGGGHVAADEMAEDKALRGYFLARSILMAGEYTYLGLPRGEEQFVWGRREETVTEFQPPFAERHIQRVVAIRMALRVDINQTSPQVQGQPLEELGLTVNRANGEVLLFEAEYTFTE